MSRVSADHLGVKPMQPHTRSRLGELTEFQSKARRGYGLEVKRLKIEANRFHTDHPELGLLLNALDEYSDPRFYDDVGRVVVCPDDQDLWGPMAEDQEQDRAQSRQFRRGYMNFAAPVPCVRRAV